MLAAPKAVSLFSSAGIGDLGLAANGIDLIASSELLQQRHDLYRANFPSARCFTGDIQVHKDKLIEHVRRFLNAEELFLLLATPPCQGMSTNGVGKLLAEIRAGNRAPMDERNRLIIPTMDVVTALRPRWLVLRAPVGEDGTIGLHRRRSRQHRHRHTDGARHARARGALCVSGVGRRAARTQEHRG